METEKQTTEVRETDNTGANTVERQTVTRTPKTSGVVVAQRVVWYIAGVIIVLLALRVVLQLLAANDNAGFVSFVYSVSGIFAAPFFGIFSYEPTYGKSYFEISSVVAIAVYALVAWGIAKLLTLGRPQDEV